MASFIAFIKELVDDSRHLLGLPVFGKKHVEMTKCLMPGLAAYSAAAVLFGLYFTDWKVVVKKIPFYNTKFSSEEE